MTTAVSSHLTTVPKFQCIDDLPEEIQRNFFEFLDISDLINTLLVSRKWQALTFEAVAERYIAER